MKAAIVIPVLAMGGAPTMVVRLATAMKRMGTDVEVVSVYPRQGSILEKRIEEAGIPIHYIGKNKKYSIRAMLHVFSTLSAIKPDVIHSHLQATFYALPWILFRRIKLVHTIHTKPDVEFSSILTSVLRVMMRLKKVVLVAVSKENYAIAKSFHGQGKNAIKLVNNPVEINQYYRNSNRSDGHVVFINVSRQDANKNQIMAIRAMKEVIKQVPNAKMVLLGDGDQHEVLVRERNALGLQEVIDLPGEQSEPEHFLANADIYISTSHNEGLPLSMLEAMATGLPIISTDVGGVSDIVQGNGALIPDGDFKALVAEMVRFARDRDMAECCGRKSLEMVKAFDVKACAEAYLEIYCEA